ncbi:hypothetical protein MASR1M45_01430 [Candidatus Kapaibacterium sp.]
MKIDEIIELLKEWKEFKQYSNDGNIAEFGFWLTNKLKFDNHNSTPTLKDGEKLTKKYSGNSQFLASYYINRMNKFIKIYTKELFHDLDLYSSDDFSFLALVHQMNRPRKKELCELNLTEITTGLDIIKRLISKGMIFEVRDENDKRSKRLDITEYGLKTVLAAYQKLNEMTEDVLGDLNENEREIVINFLARLNSYHTELTSSR